jgi:hypothetical protein
MKCCKIVGLYWEQNWDKISWNFVIKNLYILREFYSFLQIKFIIHIEAVYMSQYQNVYNQGVSLQPGSCMVIS